MNPLLIEAVIHNDLEETIEMLKDESSYLVLDKIIRTSIINNHLEIFLVILDRLRILWRNEAWVREIIYNQIMEHLDIYHRTHFLFEMIDLNPYLAYDEFISWLGSGYKGDIIQTGLYYFLNNHYLNENQITQLFCNLIYYGTQIKFIGNIINFFVDRYPSIVENLSKKITRDFQIFSERYYILAGLIHLDDDTFLLILERGLYRLADDILYSMIITHKLDRVKLIVESSYEYSKILSMNIILNGNHFIDLSNLSNSYQILQYLKDHDFVFDLNDNIINQNTSLINMIRLVNLLENLGITEQLF